MAVVASLGVKRFWPLRHSRYSRTSDEWREMARMRRRTLIAFEFSCPYRESEAAVGDETIIMIRLSGIGLS